MVKFLAVAGVHEVEQQPMGLVPTPVELGMNTCSSLLIVAVWPLLSTLISSVPAEELT